MTIICVGLDNRARLHNLSAWNSMIDTHVHTDKKKMCPHHETLYAQLKIETKKLYLITKFNQQIYVVHIFDARICVYVCVWILFLFFYTFSIIYYDFVLERK